MELNRRNHTLLFKKDAKVGTDTFISLAFSLLSKKKHLFCKLQLFSQNTDVLHLQIIFAYTKQL